MKKLLLLIAISIIGIETAGAQCPPAGDITFNNQFSIDAFILLYPNCNKIDGSVTVEGADINNFYGLQHIDTITGNLIINNNPVLPILSWLDNLTYIGGNLVIDNNFSLVSFEGLRGLKSVNDVDISNNPKLTNFAGRVAGHEGLISLKHIRGSLWIGYNDNLISLSGLDKVTSIGGYLWIDANDNLISLSGLDKVTSIGGCLWIDSNNNLISLSGLDKVTSIGGWLWIGYNDNLISLSGLDKVTSIGGYLWINSNDRLTSLSGLDKVDSINGYICIADNKSLTDISAIQNIDPATVKSPNTGYKDLNIIGNPQLSECAMDLCPFVKYSGLTTNIHYNGNLCNDIALMRLMCTPPACIRLTNPVDGASEIKVNSNISWSASPDAAGYWMTAGTTQGGKDIFDDDLGNVTTWDPPNDFDSGATIYVTVTPYNFAGLLNNCPEESFSVEDISTTVSEFTKKSGLGLYPNPARNTLYLKYDKSKISGFDIFRIEIYSATGQKVKSIDHPVNKIDISNLSEGIYIVNVITAKGVASWKITVEK